MAFVPNQNFSPSFTATAERLPAGFSSYLRTLSVMAELVKSAVLDYRLKLFANGLLISSGIKGHDFMGEVASLFFSLVTAFVIRVTRWMLSLCRTRFVQSKPNPATVTTRSRFCVRCWRYKVFSPALSLVGVSRTLLTMFGVKCIWTGKMNGSLLIRQMSRQRPAGVRNFLTGLSMKSGKTRLSYAL